MLLEIPSQYGKCDERKLFEITTIDETWIYYQQPYTKAKSSVGYLRAKNVLYAIALDAYSPLTQVCVPKGQTVTGNSTVPR